MTMTEFPNSYQEICPSGEIDIATAGAAFDSAQIRHQAEQITVDLSRVTFIDAAGLGALVRLRNDLMAAGGDLRLAGVHPRHARLFVIGGLGSLL
jgi:anti-sigma B factor antagonist